MKYISTSVSCCGECDLFSSSPVQLVTLCEFLFQNMICSMIVLQLIWRRHSFIYHQTSNISPTKTQNLFPVCLCPIHWSQVFKGDNSDVVGATPTDDASTISEWSTISLSTKVRLMLWILRQLRNNYNVRLFYNTQTTLNWEHSLNSAYHNIYGTTFDCPREYRIIFVHVIET